MKLAKTVVLVGMMGSGKTAIGTALAKRLEVPFVDSDAEIEVAANSSIAEIFATYGEPFFREKEEQVIGRLLQGPPAVLSTGGGAFLSPRIRQMISDRGVSVFLQADLPLLWSRVRHKNTRPLLRTDDPRRTLGELFAKRAPIYALADLSVAADPAYSIAEMTDAVCDALRKAHMIQEIT